MACIIIHAHLNIPSLQLPHQFHISYYTPSRMAGAISLHESYDTCVRYANSRSTFTCCCIDHLLSMFGARPHALIVATMILACIYTPTTFRLAAATSVSCIHEIPLHTTHLPGWQAPFRCMNRMMIHAFATRIQQVPLRAVALIIYYRYRCLGETPLRVATMILACIYTPTTFKLAAATSVSCIHEIPAHGAILLHEIA